MDHVQQLWAILKTIRRLDFAATAKTQSGWNGKGVGLVVAESVGEDMLLFHESGTWQPATGGNLSFQNTYRWSRQEETVRLEHLRFGEKNPVYLFDLATETNTVWVSVAPHQCDKDEYTARLECQDKCILLCWKVVGPDKDQEITYRYYWDGE